MEKYRELRVLNQGTFSKVLLLQDTSTEDNCAVKQIEVPLNADLRERALREASLLQALSHPGLVAFREVLEHDGKFCTVTDYADGGNLRQALQSQLESGHTLAEAQITRWLAQLCAALSYVHDRNLLHRDLKTTNIFLRRTSREVQIGDFGIAAILEAREEIEGVSLSSVYVSPERLLWRPYSSSADMWSLGAVAYELCALHRPFEASSPDGLREKILAGSFQPLCEARYSSALRRQISALLALSPEARPSASDLLDLQLLRAAAFGPPPRLPPMVSRPSLGAENAMQDLEAVDLGDFGAGVGAGLGAWRPSVQNRTAWSTGTGSPTGTKARDERTDWNCSSEVRPVTPDVFRPVTPEDNRFGSAMMPHPGYLGKHMRSMPPGGSIDASELPGGVAIVELLDDEAEEVQSTDAQDNSSVKVPKPAWGAEPPSKLQTTPRATSGTIEETKVDVVENLTPRKSGIGSAIFRGARRLLGLREARVQDGDVNRQC